MPEHTLTFRCDAHRGASGSRPNAPDNPFMPVAVELLTDRTLCRTLEYYGDVYLVLDDGEGRAALMKAQVEEAIRLIEHTLRSRGRILG